MLLVVVARTHTSSYPQKCVCVLVCVCARARIRIDGALNGHANSETTISLPGRKNWRILARMDHRFVVVPGMMGVGV